jgi:hypothetical protein
MDHQNILGTELSLVSILLFILAHIGIGDVAAVIACFSGVISLVVNYPALKKRMADLKNRFKVKK